MCGNELDLVNSFSVMLGWVEPALSKKVAVSTKKKKTTPVVKFLDLIFRNKFFIFNISKMCSR